MAETTRGLLSERFSSVPETRGGPSSERAYGGGYSLSKIEEVEKFFARMGETSEEEALVLFPAFTNSIYHKLFLLSDANRENVHGRFR